MEYKALTSVEREDFHKLLDKILSVIDVLRTTKDAEEYREGYKTFNALEDELVCFFENKFPY
jgi:hypothetical protein